MPITEATGRAIDGNSGTVVVLHPFWTGLPNVLAPITPPHKVLIVP